MGSFSLDEILNDLQVETQSSFEQHSRILDFKNYLRLLQSHPQIMLRSSAQYLVDAMDFFGLAHEDPNPEKAFRLFQFETESGLGKIMGHQKAQHQIYRSLKAFALQGFNHQLLLLHGPNGSAKSSLTHSLMNGLELYSEKPEGALYTFEWIFPLENLSKTKIGFNDVQGSSRLPLDLSEKEIGARIPCDLKDHPMLLIPKAHRSRFLEKIFAQDPSQSPESLALFLREGDLCHRCKQLFDLLLQHYHGDVEKVFHHIQVHRFYLSRRYRKGLITIEPQLHVDAEQINAPLNFSPYGLPNLLQGFPFFRVKGDLIDGNRGIVEFSDLLKRPVESFKYLLGACENGSVGVGSTIAFLDLIFLGSTNEVQLDAFKEFPDFTSFKARIELIRVPYLLKVSQEQGIYETLLDSISAKKHVAPHVAWCAALWAILTRLKKPDASHYSSKIGFLFAQLTPLEKALFLDTAELPSRFTNEEKTTMRSSKKLLEEEYDQVPFFEGRIGASAREIKSLLFDAAQLETFSCLSPLAFLKATENFIKRTSEYEFLKQEPKEGYHDAKAFIEIVKKEVFNKIAHEVGEATQSYSHQQLETFLKNYFFHLSLTLKNEKYKNPLTGNFDSPNWELIQEFERIVGAPSGSHDLLHFRQTMISQVGAWSLDHRGDSLNYTQAFPDFAHALENHFLNNQNTFFTHLKNALLYRSVEKKEDTSESDGAKNLQKTINSLVQNHRYCPQCAIEALQFFLGKRSNP